MCAKLILQERAFWQFEQRIRETNLLLSTLDGVFDCSEVILSVTIWNDIVGCEQGVHLIGGPTKIQTTDGKVHRLFSQAGVFLLGREKNAIFMSNRVQLLLNCFCGCFHVWHKFSCTKRLILSDDESGIAFHAHFKINYPNHSWFYTDWLQS